jgi:catechol 1,2-dioxygenase
MNRQNFIRALGLIPMLNFVLGKKTANAAENHWSTLCRTQRDQEGPFYKTGAPERTVIEKEGQALEISGKVFLGTDCSTPVKNAVLDLWHCDKDGNYDMQGYKCRGQVKTDANGKFVFTTIFPPSYGNRPRHIHVKVNADGLPSLTTQIYFKGDSHLANDFARNAEEARVIPLTSDKSLKKGTFNIYL